MSARVGTPGPTRPRSACPPAPGGPRLRPPPPARSGPAAAPRLTRVAPPPLPPGWPWQTLLPPLTPSDAMKGKSDLLLIGLSVGN